VTTNQAFLRSCLLHPVFAAGGATTAFIGQHQDALLATDPDTRERAGALAAVLLYETANGRRQGPAGRRMLHKLPISLRFDLGGATHNASLVLTSHRHFDVTLGGKTFVIEIAALADDSARFVCDGVLEASAWHRDGATLLMQYRGLSLRVEDKTRAASARQGESGGDGKLRASMNGRVVAVLADVGQIVQAGQPIVTLEAMKMEHVHTAPLSGKLTAVHVATGEQVAASRVVAEIEAIAEEGGAK
jgi:geranyl-CoA carboxylase alpha subunit